MEEFAKKPTRTVSDKVIGAEKGHLGDVFEVADWLENGRFSLDIDKDKASIYYEDIKKNLTIKRPYFSSLEIVNYKGVRKTIKSIQLDPYVNIFVGVNGSGKTTIIESISKACSWLVNGIRNRANGKGIESIDINNSLEAKDSAIITTLNLDDKSTFELTLYKNKSSTTKARSSLSEFKNLAEMYYFVNSEKEGKASLPLFAYYSVGRALEIKIDDQKDNGDITPFNNLDGYNSSFEESKNFKELIKWMLFCNSQTGGELDSLKSNLAELEVKYNTTLKIYNILPDETKEATDIGIRLKAELDIFRSDIISLNLKKDKYIANESEVVKDAIYRFMDISNIRMKVDKDAVAILMDKNDVTISATDLSQGEKALFSLVSDISRRLILLNPGKGKEALNGFGVVIIDEIELHLHPKWQQEIIGKLQDTFPNIQFILTTHSPQVLSTLPTYCIKVIRNDGNGMLSIDEPEFSLGSESKMILEDIFLVDSRPENIDEVKMLKRYEKLVMQDRWDTDEAKDLIVKLEEWAGKHDPVIKKLNMDVRLREYRRGKI